MGIASKNGVVGGLRGGPSSRPQARATPTTVVGAITNPVFMARRRPGLDKDFVKFFIEDPPPFHFLIEIA